MKLRYLNDFWPSNVIDIREEYVVIETGYSEFSHSFVMPYDKRACGIANNEYELDTEWSEIFGWWLSEGHIYKKAGKPSGVAWSLASDEQYFVDKISKMLINKGLTRPFVGYRDKNTIRIESYSKPLAMFLLDNFGEYSNGKVIPYWMMRSKKENVQALLKSIALGDGCLEGLTNNEIRIYTASRIMVSNIVDMCFGLGAVPSVYTKNRGGNKLTEYAIALTGQDANIAFGVEDFIEIDKRFYSREGDKILIRRCDN